MTQRNPNGGRTVRHVVRVTPDEEERLQALGTKHGVSVSRLMLEAGLGTTPMVDNRALVAELESINYRVKKEGDLLNQLVKEANSGTRFDDHIIGQIGWIRATNQKINVWLDMH